MEKIDKYQKRYLAHQKRKAEELIKAMDKRHSCRIFGKGEVDESKFKDMIVNIPSSCNRKAVNIYTIKNRDDKALLSGLLVGGVGWIHRADKIFILLADMNAYKSPAEKDFMPYLDAGVIVMSLYITATIYKYNACYVNPNIRKQHQYVFDDFFKKNVPQETAETNNLLFCGAFAVGTKPTKGEL